MKKFTAFLLMVLLLTACAKTPPAENSPDKIKIATTIFPLKDIAENIGGDKVGVVSVLPAGASPHTFEPTPSTIRNLQDIKIAFAIGNSLDNWMYDLIPTDVVTVDQNIDLIEYGEHEDEHGHEEEHGEIDPHYWLTPNNGKKIATNIAENLIKIDPENKDYYEQNLEKYLEKLSQTDQQIIQILQNLENKQLITFHDSWAYFADTYDLEVVAVFEPSPGKEPSPRYLEELYKTAKEHNIQTVYSEPQLASGALEPFIEDLGLKVALLDPIGGFEGRNSYIDLLIYNANTIAK